MSETINVPAVMVDASAVARIKSEVDISDRSRIVTFGDRAQRPDAVVSGSALGPR